MAEAAEKKTTTRAAKEPELNIYQRVNLISQEAGALAPESKGGVPFAFRGIDGTVAHLTPFMHKYGVFNTSKVLSHVVTEREAGSRVVKTTQVEVEFQFFAPDGTSVTMVTPGLADDFGDRSSAQAMSVAYRIALLQLFHLPTHTKEPEETGQSVMDHAAGSAPRGPKAVETAKASSAATGAGSLTALQSKAKALGKELGMEAPELNELAESLAAGNTNWFNDADVMGKLVKALTDKKKALTEKKAEA